MSVDAPAEDPAFPGPAALGRGLVIEAGGSVPSIAADWPRLVIDKAGATDPTDAVATLDRAWRRRQATIVELAVPFATLKAPEACDTPPYELTPGFGFERERLHFLIWANRYDGRTGALRWHHTRRALALGADPIGDNADHPADTGDVLLPDGTTAWIDGGPRTALSALPADLAILHVNQLWAGYLTVDRRQAPRDNLAPDQAAAVIHAAGPARVLAPAGSGKTRVLTARLRHLLRDRGWAPSSVTALAYNNRAAAEMRERTSDLANAQVRTIHSLGYEILGRARGGRPKLLDERQVRHLLEELAPVRHRANDDVLAPYLEALAEVRAALRPPEVVGDGREDVPGFAELFPAYRARLARLESIDHDEQVYGAVEALLQDPELRRTMQRRCAHLLLDELQDLTPAQLLMARLVAAPSFDVYGVGDDDQVIYGYAGADPRFLVNYDHYFPGAAEYLLDVNYRCPAPVVEAASLLLANNRKRVPKQTRSATPDQNSGLTVASPPEDQLGEHLVLQVQELLEAGAEPTDVAVLTRVNAGLLAPQVLLQAAGIPVEPAVDERMLDRTGARAALAWLRLAAAVRDRRPLDGTDLATAARRPPRKLSRGVLNALGRGEWPLRRLASFADGLDKPTMRSGLQAFHRDLDRLGRKAQAGESTTTLLTEIRDTVGLGGALDQLDGARSSPRGGHADDVDALILVARARPDLTEFEPWLRQALRTPSRTSNGQQAIGVTLSTVHRVKGLEWPHVVIWDASDGVMPHHLSNSGDGLEEERRVFHVALTRAQETATVLARAGAASPFVAEMAGKRSRAATRPPQEAEPPARPKRSRNPDDMEDPAPPEQTEALKAWRRRRAEADGVPAYVVLNDRHLEGIARRTPQSLEELHACDGIGPTKLERYGQEILDLLRGQT